MGAGLRPALAAGGPFVTARASEPVVLTGAQVPAWSGASATGVAAPYPSGSLKADGGDGVRSAHNGVLEAPPASAQTGVSVDQVTAFRWDAGGWREIPVQVDKKYPYFLANGHSGFAFYSGTDEELTYSWAPDAHDTGEEAWKKVFGGVAGMPATGTADDCYARYEAPGRAGDAELAAAEASGVVGQPQAAGIPADDYRGPQPDPVATLDNDDEISFMAGDAGSQAPPGAGLPADATNGQMVTIFDPVSQTDGFVYLFLRPGGSSFTWRSGYVRMTRDAGADQWIDRDSFSPDDPLKMGTSNRSYGPNIGGQVCVTAPDNAGGFAAGQPHASGDRQPRDGMTIATPTYTLHADGRWLVRDLQVARPGQPGVYGPNLIQRWKGRAFQQSPDSTVSLVGFEDEQVNWEMNSTLLGWRVGPVRAIREIWGADSGTNVTKTETYYRDADVFHYHVRVHPIPPDGLYTSWDYRLGAVTTYYNRIQSGGVAIDGVNDNHTHVDQGPTGPTYFDTCDPTFDVCSALENPEEVAGPNGGLVYVAELAGPTSAVHPAVMPYYRDDACLDDGTGDAPAPRPYPGDASTDPKVEQGYVDYWKAHGAPATLQYSDLKCNPADTNPNDPPWQKTPFAGAIGQSGLHFFFTSDSDNAFTPKTVDEIDAQQWRYEIPMSAAANKLDEYGNNVVVPLRAVVTPSGQAPGALVPESPAAAALLLVGAGLLTVILGPAIRRRGPA